MKYLFIILSLFVFVSADAQGNRTSLKKGIQKCLDGLGDPIADCCVKTDSNGEQYYISCDSLGDDWGTQVVEIDFGLSGDGTTGNELEIDTTSAGLPTYDYVDSIAATAGGGVVLIPPFSWDGNGATVTTGNTIYWIAPYNCTIVGWSIVATGTSPTCTIDVWRVATGTSLPTVANTIMGTKPELSSGNAVRSSTLTAWNPTAVTAGDIWAANLDATANATWIKFTLEAN